MTHGPLFLCFVFLAASVLVVPIAKRLGLGSVLGYLLAGIAIGPSVLGIVGHEGKEIMHFAEFGVVMMLFLVGLELRPALLYQLRRPILGFGGLQVLLTTLVVAAASLALGLPWKTAIAVGTILSMSSTAIVLQTLNEKSLLKTPGGQAAFSVLLFQDIAVIPILAVFPLLAVGDAVSEGTKGGRPGWLQGLLVLGAVGGVVLAGRFLVRPIFRFIAETRLREIFTASALLLVIGVALLMQSVNLSPALGTFVAGVVLADSEYRHELESDIEPFKGLLLGVFFVSVGAQIDFPFIATRPVVVGALVVVVVAAKLGVIYAVARGLGLDRSARWLTAFALAQVGEFAFVLLAFAGQVHVLPPDLAKLLVAVVALSMAATPGLFIVLERLVLPRVTTGEKRPHDEVTHDGNEVIFAGHGRFGQIVGRMLRANGVGTTVLDLDPEMVDVLRRLGMKVYYGDASRPELLATAGMADAKLFILAIDDKEATNKIAELVRHTYPKVKILARARDRVHYYELKKIGVHGAFRETYGSSIELGIEAFRMLGARARTAHTMAQKFREHDSRAIDKLADLWGTMDQDAYFSEVKRVTGEAERLMREEAGGPVSRDGAWDDESLRKAARNASDDAEEPTAPEE